MPQHRIALEDLYNHHDPDIVVDAMPALIAWLTADGARQPFHFNVEHEPRTGAAVVVEVIELRWDIAQLALRDPGVRDRARRFATGATVQREHLVELAGYGLAMAGIAALMPGARISDVRRGLPPDLLFDITPAAIRGVEVAARSAGGYAGLRRVRRGPTGKQAALVARADVVEAHLSLWCADPRVGIHAKIKP